MLFVVVSTTRLVCQRPVRTDSDVCVCVCVCVCVRVYVFVCARRRLCVIVCERECVRLWESAFSSTSSQFYIKVCVLPACLPSCLSLCGGTAGKGSWAIAAPIPTALCKD